MTCGRIATRLSVLLAVASVLLGSSAVAQSSTSTGLMASVHVTGMSLAAENGDTIESGGGAGGRLGWGVTKHVTLFVGGDHGRIDTAEPGLDGSYRLTQGDVGALYNFRAGKSFLPYLEGAVTTRMLASTLSDTTFGPTITVRKLDINTQGIAVTFGAGFNYFFTPIWALNLGLNWSTGKFEDFKVDGTRVADTGFNATGARFHFGVTLYPMK